MNILELGSVEVTGQASRMLDESNQSPETFLEFQRNGMWESEGTASTAHNRFCAENGLLVAAEFELRSGELIWVVTAADRTRTIVQTPSEYMTHELSIEDGYRMWSSSYDSTKNGLIAVETPVIAAWLECTHFRAALDLGTGTGRHVRSLATQAQTVIGIDLSLPMLGQAGRLKFSGPCPIGFIQADITAALPIASSAFDLVLCSLVLSHIQNVGGLFIEVSRVLSPGVTFILSMFHSDAQAAGWRTSIRHPEGLYRLTNYAHTNNDLKRALASAGFSLLDQLDRKVTDVPAGYMPPGVLEQYGDIAICTLMKVQKRF